MPSTGPDPSQITAMQSLLTAHRLNAHLPADGVLSVELRGEARITVATADDGGPRCLWCGRVVCGVVWRCWFIRSRRGVTW